MNQILALTLLIVHSHLTTGIGQYSTVFCIALRLWSGVELGRDAAPKNVIYAFITMCRTNG